jgi:hypothetical protein
VHNASVHGFVSSAHVARVVTARQPSVFIAHVAAVVADSQKFPAIPMHPEGGAGHVQAALGAVPIQGLPEGHVDIEVMARQPSASGPQVTSMLPWQELPAPAAHAAGGAGQEQLALGCDPVQGFPVGHVRVFVVARQPLASVPQVASTSPARQTVPGPGQSDGGAGHVHIAVGGLPMHGFPAGQVCRWTMARQPAVSRPHWAALVVDSQNVPGTPLHWDGGCGQVQAALGAVPAHGFPVGHDAREVTARQPLVSSAQVTSMSP